MPRRTASGQCPPSYSPSRSTNSRRSLARERSRRCASCNRMRWTSSTPTRCASPTNSLPTTRPARRSLPTCRAKTPRHQLLVVASPAVRRYRTWNEAIRSLRRLGKPAKEREASRAGALTAVPAVDCVPRCRTMPLGAVANHSAPSLPHLVDRSDDCRYGEAEGAVLDGCCAIWCVVAGPRCVLTTAGGRPLWENYSFLLSLILWARWSYG